MTAGDNQVPVVSAGRPMAVVAGGLDSESQNQRDKRVEDLWRRLDPQGDRELDLKGLKKGLRRIDHPMKNADDMLREIIQKVDANGDGKIQYEEFRVFVEAAERQLLLLFRSIDRNQDGRLNRDELRTAFQRCGLSVPARRLNGFFDEIDMNHDGYITFDEWRDFLLFIPIQGHDSALEAAFSYYASIVVLNAEGDSMVSDETLEGLGTTGFLLQALFGSIVKLAQPSLEPTAGIGATATTPTVSEKPDQRQPPSKTTTAAVAAAHNEPIPPRPSSKPPPSPPPPPLPPDSSSSSSSSSSRSSVVRGAAAVAASTANAAATATAAAAAAAAGAGAALGGGRRGNTRGNGYEELEDLDNVDELNEVIDVYGEDGNAAVADDAKLQTYHQAQTRKSKFPLTQYLPHPGYFLAGALAGGISRTATAPLDRLKVYLLVNTRAVGAPALQAAKSGSPLTAVRTAGRPIRDAVATLYKAGGLKTFFAGNGLNVIKIMPETAIKFGSYEAAKRTCAVLEGHGDPTHINPYSKFVAGGVAGMVAQFFVYPLDTLKFRLQCETVQGGPTGRALLVRTARAMVAGGGGVRTAYRGVTMGLIGMFPYSAIDMGTFELLKGAFTRYKARALGLHEEDAAPGNVVTGVIGATSGAFGASVVYPLNVLRTRLQTQGTVMHPPTYTGIWDVAHRTLANEGVRGLYKGLTPNLLKVAPALSITWVVYENSKKFLGLP
ncbi:calcium dependent mitochondrial carrier protein [Niveomyces insectorum RCEF 264]|uniref:Mitochondrial thiamine pyrophosphate carrier 1 n=1 Tax=Niveomyces insectorum RCEF 264 TaxID=1081102 RepID=A0A167QT98_9HYPO|nr:calcium dependent mitochondrial carrier protein [Niveomyces insectorum RCEF 264]